MIVLLLSILATLVFFAGLPFLIIFFEAVGAWYDKWIDRLEIAAERFCRKHGRDF